MMRVLERLTDWRRTPSRKRKGLTTHEGSIPSLSSSALHPCFARARARPLASEGWLNGKAAVC